MKIEKCYSCGGKGTYSQIHGYHGAEDFGGDGFNEVPKPHIYPCKACKGTGRKLSVIPDGGEALKEELHSLNEPTTQDILNGAVFKIELDKLSNLALELSGKKYEYTDEDMSNACLVFMEVFMNRMYDFHKDKCSQEQMEELAEEAGSSLRQTVLLFTGVDLHKVYK